jgi:ABC-type phosphate/phosphonate transport system substrate-binding protein
VIASLPMYDLPDCRAANDRYWALIRDGLRAAGMQAPEGLTRDFTDYVGHWVRPDLVFSQTCGLPLRTVLRDRVTLIGTPDVGLDGCPPGYYQSVFVVHNDDSRDSLLAFRDARFAFNEPLSQSGWGGPQAHTKGLGFLFRDVVETGAHAISVRFVRDGLADIAAIDAHTWRLLQRNDQSVSGLRVVGRTEPTPSLPYIAALGVNHRAVFAAVTAAIAALTDDDRALLGIKRLLYIPAPTYLAVPAPVPPDQIAHSN